MVVAMPPTSVASPIGIRMPDALVPARSETLTRIGSSNTTIGVLLTKALSRPASTSVSSSVSCGLCDQMRASRRPTGSSAPVRTRP